MKINNLTSKSAEEIESNMKLVGIIKNNWRQRLVKLYKNGEDDMLYMIGTAFDKSMQVISYEPIGHNEAVALDYWQHGEKVYTRD